MANDLVTIINFGEKKFNESQTPKYPFIQVTLGTGNDARKYAVFAYPETNVHINPHLQIFREFLERQRVTPTMQLIKPVNLIDSVEAPRRTVDGVYSLDGGAFLIYDEASKEVSGFYGGSAEYRVGASDPDIRQLLVALSMEPYNLNVDGK